jgi:hypothetical protein
VVEHEVGELAAGEDGQMHGVTSHKYVIPEAKGKGLGPLAGEGGDPQVRLGEGLPGHF